MVLAVQLGAALLKVLQLMLMLLLQATQPVMLRALVPLQSLADLSR